MSWTVLLAEDSRTQALDTRMALEGQGFVVTEAYDGREALRLAERIQPDLILSDVLMPRMDGFQLCRRVRSDPDLREVPFVLRTSIYEAEEDRSFAAMLGADLYLDKSTPPEQLGRILRDLISRPRRIQPRLLDNEGFQQRYGERLLDRLVKEVDALERAYDALETSYEKTLHALVIALDARDAATELHSRRVTEYAVRLGESLGVTGEEREGLRRGALLHDIGKIGVPDHILRKPGPLTDAEWVEMRKHPEIGYRMLCHIDLFEAAGDLILSHHERWDGGGYPRGLSGEDVPLSARIFAVADTVDAITSDRPYRRANTFAAALSVLTNERGTQFDPGVVDAALRIPASDWEMFKREIEGDAILRKAEGELPEEMFNTS